MVQLQIKFLTGVPTVIINKHGTTNILNCGALNCGAYRISSVTRNISVGGTN